MQHAGVFDTIAIERVVFGRPCAEALAEEAKRIEATRLFLIVSKTLDAETDHIDLIRKALGVRYAGSCSGIPSHTPRDAIIEAAARARAANADLIVTYGGGSVTDAGKMVQLCLKHGITAADQLDGYRETIEADGVRVSPAYDGPKLRQIAVPTTLSAGEFGAGAGCTDTKRGMKELYRHRLLVPRVVILDPQATVPTPEWLWLSTGIRALDHAVETICSQFANPQSDGPALQALKLLSRGLPLSNADPQDLGARRDCQIAAWASMDHNQSRVPMGASHGIGHVLGGACDVPHGHTSCVMLPNVLRFNRSVNGDRQALVSEAMGQPGADAADVVQNFVAGLGLPTRLRDVGVDASRFQEVAEKSMHDRYIHTNPRPLGVDDVMAILEQAA